MTKLEKRRSGFTFIETMVVVAIVVILAAVAVAGLTDYASSLTHLERMNSAKAIYIAAQNRLVNLKTLNKAAVFQEEALSQHYHTGEAQDDEGNVIAGLVYVDEDTTAVIDELLPEGAISSDIRDDGYYYIDFDPVNDYVYGVFFSEKSFSYSEVSAIRGDETALKRAEVGYYGQSSLANMNGSVVKLSPAFSLTNGEELFVTAKYTGYFVSETAAANWEMSVTIEGLGSGESHTYETTPADVRLSGNIVSIEFVIDSLKPGESFYEKFGASGYEPGERLSVTAQMTYTGSAVTATPSDNRSIGTVNSLYDNVIGADIHVSCGRHLQNLSTAVSHVSYAGMLPVDAVNTITFTSDIDWENGTLDYYSGKYDSSGDITFEQLENSDFFGTTGVSSDVTIAGEKHVVSNVTLSGGISSSCAGFFPVLNLGTGKVTNLFLKNLKVTAEDCQYIGGFTGYLISGSITGCGVYGESSYEDVLVRSTATTATNPAGLVGGFAGKNDGTIKESFAVGIVDSKASSAGGFSGWNEGTIECCYANCYTYAWSRAAGFSVTNRGKIYGSFALICAESDSAASGVSAGFVLTNSSGTISGCYSAMNDVDYNDTAYELTYPFAPVGVGSMTNCYYYYSGVYNDAIQAGTRLYTAGLSEAASLLSYNDGVTTKTPWRSTLPVTKKYSHIEVGADQYIYPTPLTTFYGDWPADSTLRINGVYPTDVVNHLQELDQEPYSNYYVELPYDANGRPVYDAEGNPTTVKYWLINKDEAENFTAVVNDDPSLYNITWLSTAGAVERTGNDTSKLYTGDDTGLYTISAVEKNSGSRATAYVIVYSIRVEIDPETLHLYYDDKTSADIDIVLTVKPEVLETINWMPLEKYIDGDVDWDIEPYDDDSNPVVENADSDNETITVELIQSGSAYRFGTSYVTATFTDTLTGLEHELVSTVSSLPSNTAAAYLEFDDDDEVSGFFLVNDDGNYIDNVSTNNENDITSWYYGIVSPKSTLSVPYTSGHRSVTIILSDGSEIDYYFYPFTDAGTAAPSSGKPVNRQLTVDGATYTYHMLFACGIKKGTGAISTTNNTFQIRTADQLQNINYYDTASAESTYLQGNNTYNQTHDITITSGFKPIGRGGTGTKAFIGIYDGHGYTLEDYKNTDYPNERFIGLFGQLGEMSVDDSKTVTVSNEKPGIIRNVVMLATNPEEQSGLIVATYNPSPTSNIGDTSVGTLVGLIYTPNSAVENCVVSGYTVDYTNQVSVSFDIYSHLGGLVGINMGTVKNCSVISSTLTARATRSNIKTYVSGLVGANFGTIEGCYAGGELSIDPTSSGARVINGLAGFSGGTWGNRPYHSYGVKVIRNSYSICRIQPSTATVTVYPVSPTSCSYGGSTYTHTVTNCYYLTNTVSATVAGSGSGGTGLAYQIMDGTQLYSGNTFIETLNSGIAAGDRNFGNATAAHTYPYSGKLTARPYPFPAIVRNTVVDQGITTSFYVHYGDWPLLTDYSVSLTGDRVVTIGESIEIAVQSNDEEMTISRISSIQGFDTGIISVMFEGNDITVTGVDEGETTMLVTVVGSDGLIYRVSATITVLVPKVSLIVAPDPCEILVGRTAYLTVAAPSGWSFDETDGNPTLEIMPAEEGGDPCFEIVGWELQNEKYWVAEITGVAASSANVAVQSAFIVNDLNTDQKKETISETQKTVTVYPVPDGFEAEPTSIYMDEGVSENLTLTLPEDCTNDSPEITFKVYNSAEVELAETDWPFTLNNPEWTPGTNEEGRITYTNAITSKEDAWGDYRIEISLAGYTFTFGEEEIPVTPSAPQSVALHISPVTFAVSLDESKAALEREITLVDVTEKMYVMPVLTAKADSAILNTTVTTDNPDLTGIYLWTAENVFTAEAVPLDGVTTDANTITLSNETLAAPSLYRVTCTFTAREKVYTDSYYVLVYEITVTPTVSPATLEFAEIDREESINLTAGFSTALSSSEYYEITGTGVTAWSSEATVESGTATHTVTYTATYTDEFGNVWPGSAAVSGDSTFFVNPGTLSNQSDTGATYTVTRASYVAKTIYVPVASPTSGHTYLIVSSETAGETGYALRARSGSSVTTQYATALSVLAPTVTFYEDAEGAETAEVSVYLDPSDTTGLLWTCSSSSSGYNIRSVQYSTYLYGASNVLRLRSSTQRWYYDSSWDELYSSSYYSLYYNGSTYTASSRYSSSVYFYEATTVYVEE